mmetsp:Transcript_37955/g.90149  ORF Transcript_37955/g.90149 Transcript_37955/m.90149 type:complete len:80 (-) Transcript_37955:265-504(-)
MKVGKPLSDEDRKPWLKKLHDEIRSHSERGEQAVFACSALKAAYRKILRGGLAADEVGFVLLSPGKEELRHRLEERAQA